MCVVISFDSECYQAYPETYSVADPVGPDPYFFRRQGDSGLKHPLKPCRSMTFRVSPLEAMWHSVNGGFVLGIPGNSDRLRTHWILTNKMFLDLGFEA